MTAAKSGAPMCCAGGLLITIFRVAASLNSFPSHQAYSTERALRTLHLQTCRHSFVPVGRQALRALTIIRSILRTSETGRGFLQRRRPSDFLSAVWDRITA